MGMLQLGTSRLYRRQELCKQKSHALALAFSLSHFTSMHVHFGVGECMLQGIGILWR